MTLLGLRQSQILVQLVRLVGAGAPAATILSGSKRQVFLALDEGVAQGLVALVLVAMTPNASYSILPRWVAPCRSPLQSLAPKWYSEQSVSAL